MISYNITIGWSLEGLEGWPEYIKLAVPGMVMVLAEWASFEVSSLITGAISEVELAVNGIMVSYASFLFMVCHYSELKDS